MIRGCAHTISIAAAEFRPAFCSWFSLRYFILSLGTPASYQPIYFFRLTPHFTSRRDELIYWLVLIHFRADFCDRLHMLCYCKRLISRPYLFFFFGRRQRPAPASPSPSRSRRRSSLLNCSQRFHFDFDIYFGFLIFFYIDADLIALLAFNLLFLVSLHYCRCFDEVLLLSRWSFVPPLSPKYRT
jgi:hypothetical protein